MDEWKRSGQIPAFGNWDMANELPITQYFECARQAGLVRYSSSSGESDRDLYALDFKKPVRPIHPSLLKKTRRNRETRVKENVKKQGRVWDVREREGPSKSKATRKQVHKSDAVPACPPPRLPPKPLDEDLYKIPPELLHTTKRNRMLGFISKCLVPSACVS